MRDYIDFNGNRDLVDRELTPFDYWATAVVLAILALVLGAGLTTPMPAGEFAFRVLVILGAAGGAIALFWAGLRWNRPQPAAQPQPVRTLRQPGEERPTDRDRRVA